MLWAIRQIETGAHVLCIFRFYIGSSKHRTSRKESLWAFLGGNCQQCQGEEGKLQTKKRGRVSLGRLCCCNLDPCASTRRKPDREKVKELILEALNLSLPTAEAEHIQTKNQKLEQFSIGDLMLAALTRRVRLQDNSGHCDLLLHLPSSLYYFYSEK